jgi:uncharacterized nucleotidyltransferase DUF6036
MPGRISPPWLGFLKDVDHALDGPVEVHCLGGFVLAVLWGLPRPTGDVDFIEVKPSNGWQDLLGIAGEGSAIARKHNLHFQRVTIAEYPEGYASRLIDIVPRRFKRLRLRALEIHDLVLAKLGRNSARDRADVEFLIQKGVINQQTLQMRYRAELRPYVLNEDRHTMTLRLWMEEFFGKKGGAAD